MTQPINNEERLLDDLFADETTEELGRASLARGLEVLRQRRRNQYLTRVSMVTLLAAISLCLLLKRADIAAPIFRHDGSEQLAQRAKTGALPDGFEEITDRELLALFPNDTVALVGSAGQQRLLVLDKSRPERSAVQ